MIHPVTCFFGVIRYDDKRAINIANLVKTTWMSRYPIPIEITYNKGKEFIGHEFIKSVIVTKYRIAAKPRTSKISFPMQYWNGSPGSGKHGANF